MIGLCIHSQSQLSCPLCDSPLYIYVADRRLLIISAICPCAERDGMCTIRTSLCPKNGKIWLAGKTLQEEDVFPHKMTWGAVPLYEIYAVLPAID